MAKRLIRGVITGIGRITGNILPRPLNLVVFPAPLKISSGSAIIVYGKDVPEVISGCGGLLARHSAVGGESLVVVGKSVDDREMVAIGKLGTATRTPRLHILEQDGSPDIPRGAILFYPFPLTVGEGPMIEELERNPHFGSYYYQSRILVLPEYQLRLDRALRSKLLALHALGCLEVLRFSQSAMAYGSSMAGGGCGWYESFISGDEGDEASERFVFRGEGDDR